MRTEHTTNLLATAWRLEQELNTLAQRMAHDGDVRFNRLTLQTRQLAVKLSGIRLAYAAQAKAREDAAAEEVAGG